MTTATERMKLGIMPTIAENDMGSDAPNGTTPRFSDIQSIAQIADESGVDSFWLADHLIFRFPDSPETGNWDVFTFLAGVAAVTKRIQLGPLVACTSFRNPALLAKMADSLDEISDGRFILGLGAGWHKPEYDAFGYPFDHLASRFEEALKIIVPLLHEGYVDFDGQYYQARDCALRPRGPTSKGPKIWIGAGKPRMLKLVAQHADAWNTVWHRWPAGVEKALPNIQQACAEVGRDLASLELTAGTLVKILAPGEAKQEEYKGIQGEPEEVANGLRGFETLGVKHLVVQVEGANAIGAERFGKVVEFFRQ
jgi:alkanesulfonate monooxygenase SsuD/methylene tetrahydromethanopterin reductase-like flavin-dependent oxidoreductase (luciferase family)